VSHWSTRWRAVAAASVVVAIAVVAITVTTSSPSGTSQSSQPPGHGAGGGSRPPGIDLASIDGKSVSLPAGRPGMVMFSSSTCVTCFVTVRFMADYVRAARRRIDAAFVSDPPAALSERRDSIGGTPFPFAIDASGGLAVQYGITALGTVVIFDAGGQIVWRGIEPRMDELREGFRRAGVS
jgi:hypothetical protein